MAPSLVMDDRILEAYRHRIGVPGLLKPDLVTLRRLHAAHLEAIPFENSSVRFGELVTVDQVAALHKLAIEGRGGFCYELNGAFALLLRSVGFEVDHLAARVHAGGTLGRPFEHLALRVRLDEPYLVDVGFGYSFAEPLRLVTGTEQQDPMGAFRLVDTGDGLDVEWQHRDGRWVPHYRVGIESHPLEDFAERCFELQTDASSPFAQDWICSRIRDGHGVTLMDGRFVDSTQLQRIEFVPDEHQTIDILAEHFDIRARRVGDTWMRA